MRCKNNSWTIQLFNFQLFSIGVSQWKVNSQNMSEGFIFRLKMELNIWSIFKFLRCFTVFAAYSIFKFALILLHYRHTPVKYNWATYTNCSKCNIKLKQKPGEENLLIWKRKAVSLNATINFCIKIFSIEKGSTFSFLCKPAS